MRKQLNVLTSIALALIGSVNLARAEEVVSNFDQLDGAAGGFGEGVTLATPITTGSGFNWRMDSVRMMAYCAENLDYDSLTLSLHADDDGRPGAKLEQIDTTYLSTQPAVIKFFSDSGPTELAEETTYWLVLTRSDGPAMVVLGTHSTEQTSLHGWTIGDQTIVSTQAGGWILAHMVAGIEIDAARVPLPPVVTGISGCFDSGEVTLNCPPEGGVTVRVRGKYFTLRTRVLIGGFPPTAQQFISDTEILCTLAPGTRAGLPVTVVDEAGVGLMPNALSYTESRCYGDADFNGSVNFEDITETLANWSVTCE